MVRGTTVPELEEKGPRTDLAGIKDAVLAVFRQFEALLVRGLDGCDGIGFQVLHDDGQAVRLEGRPFSKNGLAIVTGDLLLLLDFPQTFLDIDEFLDIFFSPDR